MTLIASDVNLQIVLESAVTLVALVATLVALRRTAKRVFARSRTAWGYPALAILAALVPLHYHLPRAVGVYVAWMTISVLWQQWWTFGVLQTFLSDRMRATPAALLTAAMFLIGHVVLLPSKFIESPLAFGGMIAVTALVFALIRRRMGTLHLNIFLHLALYFIAC
jgi:hypothetical protein